MLRPEADMGVSEYQCRRMNWQPSRMPTVSDVFRFFVVGESLHNSNPPSHSFSWSSPSLGDLSILEFAGRPDLGDFPCGIDPGEKG